MLSPDIKFSRRMRLLSDTQQQQQNKTRKQSDTQVNCTIHSTYLSKATSWGSRACRLRGSELWPGVTGWRKCPSWWCWRPCDSCPQPCGRCGWSKTPAFDIPPWTAAPWPPAGCPGAWRGSVVWNESWPSWWTSSAATSKIKIQQGDCQLRPVRCSQYAARVAAEYSTKTQSTVMLWRIYIVKKALLVGSCCDKNTSPEKNMNQSGTREASFTWCFPRRSPAGHFVAECFQRCPQVWYAFLAVWRWRRSSITCSCPPWIPCAAQRGSFSARRAERQRWCLPRAPASLCSLYSAVCSPSCPLLREEASAAITSIVAKNKAAHAAVQTPGFHREGLLSHCPTSRSGRTRSVQRAVHVRGHCVFFRQEHQRRRWMKKRKQRIFRRKKRWADFDSHCCRLPVLCRNGGGPSTEGSWSVVLPVRLWKTGNREGGG